MTSRSRVSNGKTCVPFASSASRSAAAPRNVAGTARSASAFSSPPRATKSASGTRKSVQSRPTSTRISPAPSQPFVRADQNARLFAISAARALRTPFVSAASSSSAVQ